MDNKPWGHSGPLAQLTYVAACAYTPEHQDRERTSEAPDQAPEVEAHIWAGRSGDTENGKQIFLLFITVSASINSAHHLT